MKLQELIVKVLESKQATRSELASVISVHPDTLSKIKSGKYNLSEERSEGFIQTILEVYPQESTLPVEEEKPEVTSPEEGKKLTDVAAFANWLKVPERKVRRILRQEFGKLEGRKQWDLSKLTAEEQSELAAKITKGRGTK